MKLRIRNKAGRLLRVLARSAAFVALTAKLLVPVGYMPAALADGGPIRLCDSYRGGLAAEQLSMPSAHMGQHVEHAADMSAAAGEEHAHEPGQHHEWKHCSLGALASAAAITSDWAFALPFSAAERIESSEQVAHGHRTLIQFRSRAPPPSRS
jgi:hypothetical protein